MSVSKLVITQALVSESSCRPLIAGRVYDNDLEPCSIRKYSCITISKRGFIGFVLRIQPGEKVNAKLAQLYGEYESVLKDSYNDRVCLNALRSGLKYLWPEAEITNESD